MERIHYIDLALGGTAAVLTAACILMSAAGMEQLSILLVSIGLALLVTIVGVAWSLWRNSTKRPAYPAILTSALSLLFVASIASTHWPLRLTYRLSRSELNVAADRLLNGERLLTPMVVGVFKIQKAELSNDGIACLWTEQASGGNTGFVQCGREHVPFNLWSIIRLDETWQFISED